MVIGLIIGVSLGVAGCSKTEEATAPDSAAGAQAAATFDATVRPIIEARCGKCHIEGNKGDLSLASLDVALAGGKSGAVILPGDAEHSLLYRMISGDPEVKHMPPKGEPLSPPEVESIKAWINSGAK